MPEIEFMMLAWVLAIEQKGPYEWRLSATFQKDSGVEHVWFISEFCPDNVSVGDSFEVDMRFTT